MRNTKLKISQKEKPIYEAVFNHLHKILMKAKNKYIQSFLGVKKYVERRLKNKVWEVKLSIHANEHAKKLVHRLSLIHI